MGKTNSVALLMGFPGSGKTTLLRQHVLRHLGAGAWAFVQDPDRQFADLLPCYETPAHYRAAQLERRERGEGVERGASIATLDEAELTKFVSKLGPRLSPYVFIGYDEAVLLSETTEHHVSPELKNLLGRRRHMGVAAALLCQDLGQIHAVWQRLSTDLFLFRCTDRGRLRTISARFGIPLPVLEATMEGMREEFDFIHIRHGRICGKNS